MIYLPSSVADDITLEWPDLVVKNLYIRVYLAIDSFRLSGLMHYFVIQDDFSDLGNEVYQ